MDRKKQLEKWLETVLKAERFELSVASADASFRRYFRAHTAQGTYIVMDAPPEKERCEPFVQIAQLFGACGMKVPEIIADDVSNGFLLLSDLGDETYLSVLNDQNAQQLYGSATDALIGLQLASQPNMLPCYDKALLMREMQLFEDWYIEKHLNVTLNADQKAVLANTLDLLAENALSQGQAYVHRDYHSRNLMVCDDGPGVLDFQDAVYGPITYDLVSLLKDAYIQWDESLVIDWVARYWEPAKKAGLPVQEDFGLFYRDFEWMGAQRHIKVLGIFARLYHRDGKDGYLKDMPLVMHYLRRVCERYPELRPMFKLLNQLEGVEQQAGYTF